jgi:putative ATP-dependent endonuclease of the OLD family
MEDYFLLNLVSIYIDGYKCFSKGQLIGFEQIKTLNILIGRNNSGKSSLLDLLSFAIDVDSFIKNRSNFQQLIIGYVLDKELITSSFLSNISGGSIHGNHLEYGLNFVGKIFHFELVIESNSYNPERKILSGRYTSFKNEEFPPHQKEHWDKMAKRIVNQLSQKIVLRLGAERNIVPEIEDKSKSLSINGEGATNIINNFINISTFDSKLVEEVLLEYLNEIVFPDAIFTDIVVQQVPYEDDQYMWEIFLEEEGAKGRIPLSKSGSGLKTIILVLIQFLLMPVLYKKKPSEILFALEELKIICIPPYKEIFLTLFIIGE